MFKVREARGAHMGGLPARAEAGSNPKRMWGSSQTERKNITSRGAMGDASMGRGMFGKNVGGISSMNKCGNRNKEQPGVEEQSDDATGARGATNGKGRAEPMWPAGEEL